MKEADVDQRTTNQWWLKAETEDWPLQHSVWLHTIHRTIKDKTDPLYRICENFKELIQHIVTSCLASKTWVHIPAQQICSIHLLDSLHRFQNRDNWEVLWTWTKKIKVTENNDVSILWGMPVHIHRPDIMINDYKEERCMLIDMAIPSERNTSTGPTDKVTKYKDKRDWN